MKFSNIHTEAGYLIAVAGKAEQEVGVRSEDGEGPIWQALVRTNRTNLHRANVDDRRVYESVRPGHDHLVWLVEDEPGHVIEHRSTDCDLAGYPERIAEVTAAFESVTQHYTDGSDATVDFATYEVGS